MFQAHAFTKQESSFQRTSSNLNEIYYHKISETSHFIGAILDNNFEGVGVIYDPSTKRVTEAGTYFKGKLNGFGLKIEPSTNHE